MTRRRDLDDWGKAARDLTICLAVFEAGCLALIAAIIFHAVAT